MSDSPVNNSHRSRLRPSHLSSRDPQVEAVQVDKTPGRMMASWMKVKTEVPKILYIKMLALLFTRFLAGFVALPVMFASIRNSRALHSIGRARKAVLSTVQNVPLLVVAGTTFGCGVVVLSWICWGNRVRCLFSIPVQ
ncbi:hypothetical protein BGZ60DRAFT_429794 [Tricladium varicosporioides]|nr:hypothetical protein BGZ60DRAFT_429794 [Hymenoscyphus varicosporioides]